MAKTESPWFKHDYNARRDPKLIRLCRVKGMKGLGIYWSIIEILHEQGGEIKMDEIGDISFELREDENNVLSVIKEFNLFAYDSQCVRNARVYDSINSRTEKSNKAKISANNRWKNKAPQKPDKQKVNANALRTQSELDASRVEESRVDSIDNKLSITLFDVFRKQYPGTKNGNETEFKNFVKKTKDWKTVLTILPIALQGQIAARQKKQHEGAFVPEWKNLSTWINNRCWEEETGPPPGELVKSKAPDTNSFFNTHPQPRA